MDDNYIILVNKKCFTQSALTFGSVFLFTSYIKVLFKTTIVNVVEVIDGRVF